MVLSEIKYFFGSTFLLSYRSNAFHSFCILNMVFVFLSERQTPSAGKKAQGAEPIMWRPYDLLSAMNGRY